MKDKTMSEVGVDFSYDQDSNEQKHTLLAVSPLENSAPKQAECNPPTCNPAPASPHNSSEWGEDNATCKSFIKPETSYVGLVNQAMTCYLNSLLQALYMTPEFRNALYNWEYVDGSEKDEANSIPYQLQKLFLNLQTSSKSAVETTALTKSFGWDSTEAWQQHDIQELCRVMFDALERKFKNTEQADLINRLYEGKMIDYVKCLECGTEKSREDTFLDIPLPVRPFGSNVAYNSVEDALRAFVQYEILEGNNQYYCEKCNKKCDAHKGLKFTKFPYLLTFHLKRFDFDFKTFHRIKLNDKVTFPDTLNLNHFILSVSNQESPSGDENNGLAKCDDSSTADSGTLDDDYPLCENSLPNSNHSTNYDRDEDYDEGIDMCNGQSTSNCTAHNYENEKNRNSNAAKGPYNYELFSIMIHSGSASGGHYYAYIKDFRTGEWLCFNDQSVTPITHDDIQKTYGGGPTRPYYSGAYSSTNAYMLMYRQIDSERNALPMQVQDFPKHIQELLKKMTDEKKELLQITEITFNSYSRCLLKERYRKTGKVDLRVFCQHPTESNCVCRLSVAPDTTLAEATKMCYKQLHLENVVSLEQCRLLNYNPDNDTIICSYEGKEKESLMKLFPKIPTRGITLFLEICDKDKKFDSYKGDIVTKVNIIDVPRKKLLGRIDVRAFSTQTIKEYKHMVGKIINMDPDEMKIVLRKQKSDTVLVVDDDVELQAAEFMNGFNVYISTMLDTECKPFYQSAICEIIENFENIITFFIELPDMSPEILEELNIPSLDEKYKDKEKLVAGSPPKTTVSESQRDAADLKCNEISKNGKCNETVPARNISPQLGESEDWNTSEQSNSEDSSLSDSDKTLVGDAPEDDDFQVPYLSLNTNNRSNVMMNQIEFENGDNVDDSEYYFKATQCDKKYIQVQVDKRMEFDTFKKNLEPYVGVPADYFRIFRLFEDYDESQPQRFVHSLVCYEDGQKFQIKLGRTVRTDEIRVKLSLFIMDSSEPLYKFLFDWIVSEDMTVSEAKKDILAELKKKFDIDIPYERCRLRERCLRVPCKVLLDDQKFGSLLRFYGELDLIVQELPDVEPVTNSNQILVFIRRWSPSNLQLGPLQEIVVDGKSVEELRKTLSTISEIPEKYIDIARARGYFPYNLCILRIQNEQGWNEQLDTKFDVSDGFLFLYRDVREPLCNDVGGVLERRSWSYSSTPRSHTRKEKALRIQLATE